MSRPPLIVSCSGGKDSTAVVLHLREMGLPPTHAVFMDTGWEERRTLDYVRDVLPGVLGMPVTWLRAEVPLPTDPDLAAVVAECEAILGWESAMVRLVVKKGVFPLRQMKWCTDLMKTQPFFEWLLTSFPATPVAFATGIRAEESATRRDMPEFSPLFRTDTSVTARWRPLVPLVLQWRPLIRWTFDDGNREDGRHDGRCMPIDEVIEWSMTSRGGRQFELFAPSNQEAGCMRWGMCDTSGKSS